jgi:hypothetical protein
MWNIYGGEPDYSSIETMMEMLGYHDLEMLIYHFALIREYQQQ